MKIEVDLKIFETLREYMSIRGLLMFFSLIAAWPCVFYLLGYLPDFKINVLLLIFFSSLYLVYNFKELTPLPSALFLIILLHVITWLLYCLIHNDATYNTRFVYIIASVLVLLLDNKKNNHIFLRIFVYWITIQAVLSAVGFFLCLFGLIQPVSTFEEMDGRVGYNFVFFTTNVYIGQFVRPSGFFDEPGALACWGVYAMVINRLIVKKKALEFILPICLITTLSLAFYIQAIIYFLYFYRHHFKKLLLIIALAVGTLGFIIAQDEVLYEATIGRVTYDKSEGTFAGDNRAELRENAKKIFYLSPIIGVGAETLVTKFSDINSNEYTILASDGILGLASTIIPYVFLFFFVGKNRPDVKICTVVLSIGLLQRPFEFTQIMFTVVVYNMINNLLVYEESYNNK